jgi:hypothetical protein
MVTAVNPVILLVSRSRPSLTVSNPESSHSPISIHTIFTSFLVSANAESLKPCCLKWGAI